MQTIAIKILTYWLTLAVLVAGLAWHQPSAEARPAAQAMDEIRPVCVTIASVSCNARLVKPLADQRAVLVNDIIVPLYGGPSTSILSAQMPDAASEIVQSGRQLGWAYPPSAFDNGQVYVYDLDRGPAARGLAEVPQRVVGFDPTGTYLVYVRYGGGLLRVRVDGAAAPEQIGLQATGAIIAEASLLPDGRILASTSADGFAGSVYVISGVETARPVAVAVATASRPSLTIGQPLYRVTPDGQRLVFVRSGVLYARSLMDAHAPVVRLSSVATGEVKTFFVSNGYVAFQSDVGGQIQNNVVPIGGPATAAVQIVSPGSNILGKIYLSGPMGQFVVFETESYSGGGSPTYALYVVATAQPGTVGLVASYSALVTFNGFIGESFLLWSQQGGPIKRSPLGNPSSAGVDLVSPGSTAFYERAVQALGTTDAVGVEDGELYELRGSASARRMVPTDPAVGMVRGIAAVSSDQRLVFFTNTQGHLYVWDRTGGVAPTPVATGTARPTVTPSPVPPLPTATAPPALTPVTESQETLGYFALINGGQSVLYTASDAAANPPVYTLYRRDLSGAPQPVQSPFPFAFEVSPDERRLIYTSLKPGSTTETELRSLNLTGTAGPGPVLATGANLIRAWFTSDGSTVLFVMGGELWRVPADGSAAAQRLSNGLLYNLGFGLIHAYSYTGGNYVLYALNGGGFSNVPVWIVPVAGPASAARQVGTIQIDTSQGGIWRVVAYPRIADDDSAVAYVSAGTASGTFQVFARALSGGGIGDAQAVSAPFGRIETTLAFGPGNDTVIFAAADEASGLGRAYQAPVAGPSSATQLLTPASVLETSIVAGRYHAETQSILLSDEAGMVYQIAASGQSTPARQLMGNSGGFWTTAGDQFLYFQLKGVQAPSRWVGELRRVSLASPSSASQLVSPLTCQVEPLRLGSIVSRSVQDYLVSQGNDRVGYVCADGQGGYQVWTSTLSGPVSVPLHLSNGVTPWVVWNGLTDAAIVLQFSTDAQRAFLSGRSVVNQRERHTLYTTLAGAPPTATPLPSPTPAGPRVRVYLPLVRR